MKVLFFVRDIKAASVTFIRTQIKLVSEYHEVLVVTVDHLDRYKVDGIPCVGIPFRDSFWTNRPLRRLAKWDWYYGSFNPLFGKKLVKELREFGPDVIHCQFGTDATIFLDHFPNATQIPVFIQFRGYDASFMYGKKSYLRRLKGFFALPWIHPIYVSLNQYERTLGLDLRPDKQRILYSCTDTDLFTFSPRVYSPEKEEVKFLQVGRLVEVKGHEFTLLAFRQAVSFLASIGKKATLTFVGEGPLLSFLQKKSRELGLEDLVNFSPSASHVEVRDFLLKSDFFLHPSVTTSDGRIEGLPNAVMEALAVGVPVVATIHSGLQELQCPHGALFLAEEWNVENYADAMVQLATGALLYDLEKSRKMIEEKFSAKQHIVKLLGFYEEEVTLSSSQIRICN